MQEKPKDVRIARIGKPHGIRGEITVELFTETPETRFAQGSTLALRGFSSTPPPFEKLTVARSRWNKNTMLIQFIEFSDRNTAESLRGFELYASAERQDDEPEGWYADELIGLHVFECSFAGQPIGVVIDLITGQAQDLLEIRLTDGREVLIPFVEEIVPEVDEERGRIAITPPPGLLELNES